MNLRNMLLSRNFGGGTGGGGVTVEQVFEPIDLSDFADKPTVDFGPFVGGGEMLFYQVSDTVQSADDFDGAMITGDTTDGKFVIKLVPYVEMDKKIEGIRAFLSVVKSKYWDNDNTTVDELVLSVYVAVAEKENGAGLQQGVYIYGTSKGQTTSGIGGGLLYKEKKLFTGRTFPGSYMLQECVIDDSVVVSEGDGGINYNAKGDYFSNFLNSLETKINEVGDCFVMAEGCVAVGRVKAPCVVLYDEEGIVNSVSFSIMGSTVAIDALTISLGEEFASIVSSGGQIVIRFYAV